MLPFCLQNFLKGDETMDFWKRAQELKDEITKTAGVFIRMPRWG